mmetsp:Transcript_620/g.2211  ORF Transcript_620/g.2211 Transcript_620/m.2211 type:complete len:210 (-) Transcript_620:2135-2764(-)
MMTTWNRAWPPMNTRMRFVMSGACLYTGLRVRHASSGVSVASDRAASVSMIMLSQRSCTGVNGSFDVSDASEPTIVRNTPPTLIASWNCKNFLMLSLTARPQRIALTTEAKLSSRSTMAEAPLAMSVPVFMAKPTSASLSAGASFVPSPVTATTSPWSCSRPTSTCLSDGDERASTRRRGSSSMSAGRSCSDMWRNSGPVMARSKPFSS